MNKVAIAIFAATTVSTSLLVGQDTPAIPAGIPPEIQVPTVPEVFKHIPSEKGEFRLYLNSHVEKGALIPLSKNKLEPIRQVDVPSRTFIPILHSTKSDYTTFPGVCPFDIVAGEVELWLRLQAEPGKRGPFEIEVTVLRDADDCTQLRFSLEESDFEQAGDEGLVQVLVRRPVENLALKRGGNLSIAVTCTGGDKLSLWGLGRSHIEFRKHATQPSPFQMVFGIRQRGFVASSKNTTDSTSMKTPTEGLAKSAKGNTSGSSSSGTSAHSAWRTWSTANGQFKTEARLIKWQDGKVHLERRDGKRIQVDFTVLSTVDQDHIWGNAFPLLATTDDKSGKAKVKSALDKRRSPLRIKELPTLEGFRVIRTYVAAGHIDGEKSDTVNAVFVMPDPNEHFRVVIVEIPRAALTSVPNYGDPVTVDAKQFSIIRPSGKLKAAMVSRWSETDAKEAFAPRVLVQTRSDNPAIATVALAWSLPVRAAKLPLTVAVEGYAPISVPAP